jgi:hypothetical protein
LNISNYERGGELWEYLVKAKYGKNESGMQHYFDKNKEQ